MNGPFCRVSGLVQQGHPADRLRRRLMQALAAEAQRNIRLKGYTVRVRVILIDFSGYAYMPEMHI